MEPQKRLTIRYVKNGQTHELVRVVPTERDEAGVLLDILGHARQLSPASDVPYDASSLERRRIQIRDQGITGVAWTHENID